MATIESTSPVVAGESRRRRSLLILYGTETGNAQDIAEELGRIAERLHFQTSVGEMNNVKLNDLLKNHALVVFIISTTGQGAFPGNSLNFWKSLRRAKLPPNCLASVEFTTFGLGDSSYAKFNWAGRQLQSRLEKLGAREAFPRGEGDERHNEGIDSIYQPWLESFRSHLFKVFPLPAGLQPIPEDQPLLPKFILSLAPSVIMNMDLDNTAAQPEALSKEEKDKQWEANKEKCADDSHVTRPRTAAEKFDLEHDRASSMVAYLTRMDHYASESIMKKRNVSFLDKANVLKDHYAKYLMEEPIPDPPQRHSPDAPLPFAFAYPALVEFNERITPADHWQDVRQIELTVKFDIPRSKQIVLQPGDLVQIYPKNFPDDVDWLIKQMGWDDIQNLPVEFAALEWDDHTPTADDRLKLALNTKWRQYPEYRPNSEDMRRPEQQIRFIRHKSNLLHSAPKATLRELLLNHYDITHVPKRSFLEKLQYWTDNEDHKERLRELISSDGSQEFYDYTSRPRRTMLEILNDFHSVKIPLHRVPDIFPIIRPRDFSIANGGENFYCDEENDRWMRIDLIAALVEYKTLIRKPRQGLCSRYLKTLPERAEIQISFKAGSPRAFNNDWTSRPMIAIATGTGIAPIRAMIQERAAWHQPPEVLLFFGCRNEAADFHYKDEWKGYEFLDVIPAFSRDKMPGQEKWNDPYSQETLYLAPGEKGLSPTDYVNSGSMAAFDYDRGKNYVQHRIREHAKQVCEMLQLGAYIVICGNAGNMPKSVRKALEEALVIGGLEETREAAEWKLNQNNPKRFFIWEETW